MQLSVILPTIRPAQFQRSWASVGPAIFGQDVLTDWEVIVVSTFECPVALPKTRWLVQDRRGVMAAIKYGYDQAHGEYVFTLNDESELDPGSLFTLWEAAEQARARGERAIHGPRHDPKFDFSYYGRPFLPFPFAQKSLLDSIGGYFDPAYQNFYADPDLSLRAIKANVALRTVKESVVRHANDMNAIGHRENVAASLERDRAVFRYRWDHLGEFRDPS